MNRGKLQINRKVLYIILCIVLISVFSLTMAYAALSVTLNVAGNAEVTGSNWDVHFENPIVKSGSISNVVPDIVSSKAVEFTVEFNMPGDFYEFTIDVVNDGTIDAMIDNIFISSSITPEQEKYLYGTLKYDNGNELGRNHLLKAGESLRYRFRAEFKKDVTAADLPTSSSSVDFSIELVYSQATENAVSGNGSSGSAKEFRIVSGDLDTVGSEVCIDTECFYVLGSDDEFVGLFSKYNLYVGNVLTGFTGTDDTPVFNALPDATGLQNPIAKAFDVENGTYKFPMYGGYPFAINNSTSYGSSDVKMVVDYYGDYLAGLGYAPLYSRLMSSDVLESLGCDIENKTCLTSEYEWLYSSSYWTMSIYNNNYIYVVTTVGDIWNVSSSVSYTWGVRPFLIFERNNLI